MKNVTLLYYLIAINWLFVSCSRSDQNSNQEELASVKVTANAGVFTRQQVERGAVLYMNNCVTCHGKDLRGTEGGNALTGEHFIAKWKEKSLGELFELTKATMPKSNPHSLDDASYASLLAFILNASEFPYGDVDLSSNKDELQTILMGTPPPPSRVSLRFNPNVYNAKPPTIEGEWLQHRGDYASTNYSPLDQINKENAKDLKIAWRWKTDNFGPSPEFYFKSTPLMAKGVLYTTAGSSRAVAAIDAINGETLWTFRFDEKERKINVPRQNSGRGVAYWSSPVKGKDRVIYISPGFQLIALDAQSGNLIPDFGDHGVVDLKKGLGPHVDPLTATIGSTSPPIIVNDVIIMGASFPVGLAPASRNQVRGDIMGYDVKTGKQLWIFHTIPQQGEEGNETWEADSWKYTGNAGAWAPLTADPELGYVYLPLEAATGDFYGGHRPGNNLFSQSLVCLNVKTGKKVWHYQLIHHDIWDYDLPAPQIYRSMEKK